MPRATEVSASGRTGRGRLERAVGWAGPGLVPLPLPREGFRREHRYETSRISGVEMGRARAAARPHRAVQAAALSPANQRVRRIPLTLDAASAVGGEIANPSTDKGTDNRPDERERNGDQRANDGPYGRALCDRILEHRHHSFLCIIDIIHVEFNRSAELTRH